MDDPIEPEYGHGEPEHRDTQPEPPQEPQFFRRAKHTFDKQTNVGTTVKVEWMEWADFEHIVTHKLLPTPRDGNIVANVLWQEYLDHGKKQELAPGVFECLVETEEQWCDEARCPRGLYLGPQNDRGSFLGDEPVEPLAGR